MTIWEKYIEAFPEKQWTTSSVDPTKDQELIALGALYESLVTN